MSRDHVIDINNIPMAIQGIKDAMDDGMEDVFKETMDTAMTNWEAGSDALGNDWASLADSTIAAKAGSDILVESGDLRRDVESESYYDDDDNAAVFTSSLEYAGVHEFGLPEKGIPKRPIFGPMVTYAGRQLDTVEDELDTNLEDAEVR